MEAVEMEAVQMETVVHTHHHTFAPSETASVMLDVGGDVGALVLYVAASELGREIEVSRVGGGLRQHAAVRERHLDHGTVCCVVIPGLTAGQYTVWADRTVPAGTVTVAGGTITEVHWSGRAWPR